MIRIYIDGVLEETAPGPKGGILYPSDSEFRIGVHDRRRARFQGDVDEVNPSRSHERGARTSSKQYTEWCGAVVATATQAGTEGTENRFGERTTLLAPNDPRGGGVEGKLPCRPFLSEVIASVWCLPPTDDRDRFKSKIYGHFC